MAFTLKHVVPWGRSYQEYTAMFCLSERDLNKTILGCGDGPAGFNADLTNRGGRIVSVDPLYQLTQDEIRNRIEAAYQTVIEQTMKNKNEFVWKSIKNIDELGKVRMTTMTHFLDDYPKGKTQERYVIGMLPELTFQDNKFDLALCSHLLFLYSEQFDTEFHIKSLTELCRVAQEVRVFPLLELGSRKSRHLDPVIKHLMRNGYDCKVEKVNYEFQKRGDQMLRIKAPYCM